MKITRLYVYPIKALRGIELKRADLGAQGIRHDRRFMLFRVLENGDLKKMQLSEVPECALFEQEIAGDESIVVRFHRPASSPRPADRVPQTPLSVPLYPETEGLETVEIDLHGSSARVYRMGDEYSSWFSACFGYEVVFVYIGDGRRPVLGSTLPPQPAPQQRGWLSGVTSYLTGTSQQDSTWLTFTDVAPLMVTTEASLRNVRARISDSPEAVDMYKFRPNIVIDGEDEWAEDFWAELTVNGGDRLLLTANCLRCTSLNVDYDTGRPAAGEVGTVLKKLMKDRRVDKGHKWSPVFGRYAFLADERGFEVSVGDAVDVTGRLKERTTWDWPGL
ncbi:Molybdenum cofactor sulfurase [Coniochaeta hoffmannii]|uniref:Molybdenum cofactor sulfurase n=1 Tax=Coniochaeta hoffmannii TaxID=91930 RepID=A0AA38VWJ3_9PEZI|nr:Molybdenum cofactor sulfurase [Coniochaeta hoffmannii]